MRIKSKSHKNNNRNRDCTKCVFYGGFISINYYACKVYMNEEYPKDIDIYDRDVLKKGTCRHFTPIEVNQDDNIPNNVTLERCFEKNDQSLPDKE